MTLSLSQYFLGDTPDNHLSNLPSPLSSPPLPPQSTTFPTPASYGKIRYAVNTARQRKLMEADVMLRNILEQAKVGIKYMETKPFENTI